MSDVKMFKLPDVGEGLTEAEIVTWNVKVGDTVKVNDVIVEIETAKSLVELPCPYAGVVTELYAAEGETVNVGTPIIAVETGDASAAPAAPAEPAVPEVGSAAEDLVPSPKDDEAVEPGLIGGPAPGGRTSVLVGYGPRTTEAKRRPRKVGATPTGSSPAAAQRGVQHAFAPQTTDAPDLSLEDAPDADVPTESVSARAGASSNGAAKVLAKPPVRKLAKDLGIDLAEVTPTGPNGTITRDDVEGSHRHRPGVGRRRAAATADRRARDARPDQGRPQDDRAGDGVVGLHGAARHRVGHRRRQPDDEDGPATA